MRSPTTGRTMGAAVALLASSLLLVVAASPASAAPGRAYVANGASDTVSVVDTATNVVVAIIPVGDRPDELAVTPDGSRVYVVNTQSGTVSVISTASNTVIATVPVGANPQTVTITPNGARAWVSGYSGTVVIDTATDTVVGRVPSLPLTFDVAFSPDGTRAYAADGEALVVVDTATLAVVAVVPGGHSPFEVEVSPDGSRVYVLSSVSEIRAYNTATMALVAHAHVSEDATDIAISPDGTRLYVPKRFPTGILVLDAATLAVLTTVPLDFLPHGIDVSPSGDRLYVTGIGSPNHADALVVVDTATNTRVATIQVGDNPLNVVVTSAVPPPPPPPVIEGATFYTDGTSARSGVPRGTRISLFTTSGVPGMAYRLVLSRDDCRTVLAVLNPTDRFASSAGVIGTTAGVIPVSTPAGRYQVCFRAPVGGTASVTAPVTLDVV